MFGYTVYVYSIQININKRKVELDGTSPSHYVGVLRTDGELSFRPFKGFVEDYTFPIKLVVSGYKSGDTWTRLPLDSRILGSWSNGAVYAVVPFRLINK